MHAVWHSLSNLNDTTMSWEVGSENYIDWYFGEMFQITWNTQFLPLVLLLFHLGLIFSQKKLAWCFQCLALLKTSSKLHCFSFPMDLSRGCKYCETQCLHVSPQEPAFSRQNEARMKTEKLELVNKFVSRHKSCICYFLLWRNPKYMGVRILCWVSGKMTQQTWELFIVFLSLATYF